MKNLNKKGFTIVELVIVIAVIAILAAVLIPTFSNVIGNANKSAAMQACRNAYADAYSQVMEDGVIDANEEGVAGDFKFVFNKENGKITCEVSEKPEKYADYTYTFTDGEWTVEDGEVEAEESTSKQD